MVAKDWKRFTFISLTSPSPYGLVIAILIVAVLFSLGAEMILGPGLVISPIFFAIGFILTSLSPALVISSMVPNFKIRWAYFIIFINQVLLVAGVLLSLISKRITMLDSLVLWTTLSFALWMAVFTAIAGMRIRPKAIFLSLVQPTLIWVLILSSINFVIADLVIPLLLLVGGIIAVITTFFLSEHLFSLVFIGMSGLSELSAFLKGVRGESSSLSIGHNIDTFLQYMKFRQDGKEKIIIAPWLHSGPLRSVGGGSLSTNCIRKLNYTYGDSYFVHVPSDHQYNPAAEISNKIMNLIKRGGKYSDLQISEPVALENDKIKISGQRIGNVYLLSLSSERIDDYDISIFYSLREKYKDKKVLFIDSHPNFPMKECINVEAFSKDAKVVEDLVDKALKELSKKPIMKAELGTSILLLEEFSLFSMVFKTSKFSILYFIADTNGLGENEKKNIKKIASQMGIKHVFLLTTDTHSLRVKMLLEREEVPYELLKKVIESAQATKKAKFVYDEVMLRGIRILGPTYYELVAVTKILSRVIPLLFLIFFIFLGILLWIF